MLEHEVHRAELAKLQCIYELLPEGLEVEIENSEGLVEVVCDVE